MAQQQPSIKLDEGGEGFDFEDGTNESFADFDFDFTKKLVDALRTPLQHEGGSPLKNNKARRCPFSGVTASSTRGDDEASSHLGADSETASTMTHTNSPVLAPTDNWVTGQAAHTCPYMRYQLGLPPLRRTPPPSETDPNESTSSSHHKDDSSSSPPQVCPYTGKIAASKQDEPTPSQASAGCPFASQLASIPASIQKKTQDGPCPGVIAANTKAAAATTTSTKWKERDHSTAAPNEEELGALPSVGRSKADIKSLFRRYRESKNTAAEITALFNKVTLKTLQRDKKELQHVAVFGKSSVKKSESSDEEATPPAALPGPVASFLSRDLAKPMAMAFMKASTNAFCERYFDLYLRMLSDSCGAPKMVTVPSFLLAAPPRQQQGASGEGDNKATVNVADHDASEVLERELGAKLIATISEAPKRTFLHDILRPLFVERVRQLTRNWTKAVTAVLETRKAMREGCPFAGRSLEMKMSAVEEKSDAIVFTLRSFSKQLRLNIMTPEVTHEVLNELLHCAHHYLLLVAYHETQVGVPNPGCKGNLGAAAPCNATRASVYPAGHRFVALMLYLALSDSLRFREYFCSGTEKVSALRNTVVSELISVQKYMENAIPGIKESVAHLPGGSVERNVTTAKIEEFKKELLPWCYPSSLMSLVDTTMEAVALSAVFTAAISEHTKKMLDNKKKEQEVEAPTKKKSDASAAANPLGMPVSKKQASNSKNAATVVPPTSAHFSRPNNGQPPQHHHQYPESFHHQFPPFQVFGGVMGPTLVTCPVTGATYNVTPVHIPPPGGQHAQYPNPYMGGAAPYFNQQQAYSGSNWAGPSHHYNPSMPTVSQQAGAYGRYTPTPTGQF
jgi:hypothetical protein